MKTVRESIGRFSSVTDPAALNQALFEVTHGLYILTTVREKPNGQCFDALMQITNAPPRIAIGIGKKSLTYEMMTETGVFGVNALDRLDPAWMAKVKRFGFQSGRTTDKFAGVDYLTGETGVPILPDAKAFYECRIARDASVDLATHMLYVADVIRAGVSAEGAPLTYNEYRNIRFGRG